MTDIRYRDGWNQWSADYDRPLGAPNGTAVKTASGWRRSFSSGTEVFLDTDDQVSLFTVTFCANSANDLTCPPSYIII